MGERGGLSGTVTDTLGYGTREKRRIFMQIVSIFLPEQCDRVNSNSTSEKIESYSKMSDNTNYVKSMTSRPAPEPAADCFFVCLALCSAMT